MLPSAVEREILIEAPVDVVWHLLTEPDQIRRWFADEAALELRAGGGGALTFERHGSYQLQVEAVEPLRRFAFRWVRRPGLVLRNDNSLLVEFILEPENGSTRLRVVESGFDLIDWSDEERTKYAEDHASGWDDCLSRLRNLAATRQAARE